MQNPIREQIRLDGRWQARQIDENTVSVFVPGSWTEKRVHLLTGQGSAGGSPAINGAPLPPGGEPEGWPANAHLLPGQWNTVELPPGALAGARLVASDDLHIARLQATAAGNGSLAVHISLAGEVAAPCPLALSFTLTAADGRRVGALDLAVSSQDRDLSLDMPLTEPLDGPRRLKAALSCGERVVDNARIDINP